MADNEMARGAGLLETHGCQMNVADSQLITGVLRRAGYATATAPEEADVILLNTCAIREHAEERVIGRLGDLARLKQRARSQAPGCSDAWRSIIAQP
jgi:tRNA-2-methylthio-N6-dimethylallyladenosine synthase